MRRWKKERENTGRREKERPLPSLSQAERDADVDCDVRRCTRNRSTLGVLFFTRPDLVHDDFGSYGLARFAEQLESTIERSIDHASHPCNTCVVLIRGSRVLAVTYGGWVLTIAVVRCSVPGSRLEINISCPQFTRGPSATRDALKGPTREICAVRRRYRRRRRLSAWRRRRIIIFYTAMVSRVSTTGSSARWRTIPTAFHRCRVTAASRRPRRTWWTWAARRITSSNNRSTIYRPVIIIITIIIRWGTPSWLTWCSRTRRRHDTVPIIPIISRITITTSWSTISGSTRRTIRPSSCRITVGTTSSKACVWRRRRRACTLPAAAAPTRWVPPALSNQPKVRRGPT